MVQYLLTTLGNFIYEFLEFNLMILWLLSVKDNYINQLYSHKNNNICAWLLLLSREQYISILQCIAQWTVLAR